MAEINIKESIEDINNLSLAVMDLALVMETEFGKITKRVNLFGTNVAKRLERIQASMAAMGAGIGGIGEGIGNIGSRIGEVGSGIGEIGAGIGAVGTGFADLGGGLVTSASGLQSLATALPAAAKGFMTMAKSLDGILSYTPEITIFGTALFGLSKIGAGLSTAGTGILNMGTGLTLMATSLVSAATGLTLLGNALPIVATGFMTMLTILAPVLTYLPQLIIFVGVLFLLSLMGEGLVAAGAGLVAIGEGFLLMGSALPAVISGMLTLIDGLINTQINIGGIITFILLSAAMFIMALAIQSINDGLGPMVENMAAMQSLFSVGLVVAIGIFAIMMLLLSLTLNKVASGINKVTSALKKQVAQLKILVPLQTISAILANPIVGGITVAVATAAGLVMMALMPKMATGGVVSSPTVAMVGEGRYPEAVVPLGNSPQFTSMKNDIAAAVVQGVLSLGATGSHGANTPTEIVLNIDGDKLARTIIPAIERENRRRGFSMQIRSN